MTIDIGALKVGDTIPEWSREGTLHHWNRFASVNYEFADHHMDDEAGRHEGFAGAFIMAPFSHAYLHALLREWMGEQGRIIKIDMRLKNPLFRGRTLTAGGEITELRPEGDETIVELRIWQTDDQDNALGVGTATVAVSDTSTNVRTGV